MEDALVDRAWSIARSRLTEERLLHTMGTAEEAARLAPLFGADAGKAIIAAALHDIARGSAPQDLLRAALSKGIMVRTVDRYCPVLLHGKVAAAEAVELGVRDPEVLLAISSHGTGRPGWTGLEKAVYLALRDAVAYAAKYGPGFVDPETVVILNEVSQGLAQACER